MISFDKRPPRNLKKPIGKKNCGSIFSVIESRTVFDVFRAAARSAQIPAVPRQSQIDSDVCLGIAQKVTFAICTIEMSKRKLIKREHKT
jgi:hypothetical protein